MLTNSYGLPLLESSDFATLAGVQKFAAGVDEHLRVQEGLIHDLENPEAIILKMPANQAITSISNVDFSTIVFRSRGGAFGFGGVVFSLNQWRPGIYRIGAYVQFNTALPINGVSMDVGINDKRGASLLDDYQESYRSTETATSRAAMDLTSESLFAVYDTYYANAFAKVTVVGGGTATAVSSPSKMWCYRVRGL